MFGTGYPETFKTLQQMGAIANDGNSMFRMNRRSIETKQWVL
jgi:hypothetical protein